MYMMWIVLAWPGGVPAQTWAQFHTALGDLLVQLYDQEKPVTVQNFQHYVTSGAYRDMFIHRWEPQFVIQGGGYYTAHRFMTNEGIAAIPVFPQITNEYGVGRVFSNIYGTLAMARVGGKTNSASSQWFFNLTNNVLLDSVDGGFTVFGHVLLGTNVLNRFNEISISNGIFQLQLVAPLNELPVLLDSPTNFATFNDLVYVDVSLPASPKLQIVSPPQGDLELSWNSLSNFLNVIEFANDLPTGWQTLVATNGHGGIMQINDPGPLRTRRFYRVRLE
jgi:peptidyl-prolyl cis-trans isomerase A (cyclophilin A)